MIEASQAKNVTPLLHVVYKKGDYTVSFWTISATSMKVTEKRSGNLFFWPVRCRQNIITRLEMNFFSSFSWFIWQPMFVDIFTAMDKIFLNKLKLSHLDRVN